jgi:hypothetical protein
MKPTFVRRMLAHYPNWHEKPFRLSYSEIEKPYLVFEEFFERYDLENIRTELKEMLTDALADMMHDDPTMYVGLYDNLEKLVEACYVLYRSERDNYNFLEQEPDAAEIEEAEANNLHDDDETEEIVRFEKPISLIEITKKDSLKGIRQVFQTVNIDIIKDNLVQWFNIAMCDESGKYETPIERADLIVFVPKLERLYEALYAIRETERIKEYAGRDKLSPGLHGELCKDESFEKLSDEEIAKPNTVLTEFFKLFSYRYARIELWDMLDAAVTYDGENPEASDRLNLLLEYECMSALLYAAYKLNNSSGTDSNSN